jgi:hypothetical protein
VITETPTPTFAPGAVPRSAVVIIVACCSTLILLEGHDLPGTLIGCGDIALLASTALAVLRRKVGLNRDRTASRVVVSIRVPELSAPPLVLRLQTRCTLSDRSGSSQAVPVHLH